MTREGCNYYCQKLRRVRDAIKYSQSLLSEEALDNQSYICAQKGSMAKPIKLQSQKHTQKTAGRLMN